MRFITSALASLLVLAVLGIAAPAQAAGPIKIHRVYYDSPGSDTGSNSSLNAEYITLKNTGARARSLQGWTIRDPAGHVYRFGAYRLGAGNYVTIHTGKGSNTQRHRYWGQNWYVWNNTGDTARLRRADGTLVDRCSWADGRGDKYC